MKLLLGKNSLSFTILNVALNWFRFWIKRKFGIDLPESVILKMYYEFDRFASDQKLGKLIENVDEEKFINFLNEFVQVVDQEKEKNPAILQNRKLMWEIFKVLKDYLNRDWIKNSSIMNGMKEELNNKIIHNKELLDYKVKRDVDRAIVEYEKLEEKDDSLIPIITTKENKENPFGFDEIRIRGKWVQE